MKTLCASPHRGSTQCLTNWPRMLWIYFSLFSAIFLLNCLFFFFFPRKWSLCFFLTNLRALSVMSNSFPNYLQQMQMTLTTIKLFDLKRLGDYGMQFYTSFNDFVRANLTLWINLPLVLKIKWYCIDIIKGNFKTFWVTLTSGKFFTC